MNSNERKFIAAILLGIFVMVSVDLVTDANEGVRWWHLLAEGIVALAAIFGVFFLLRGSFALRRSLEKERKNAANLEAEANKWRTKSKKHVEGLSLAIDEQLTTWNLTNSEKEIAFLLLKGLSLKEIADVRNTAEKTARTQSTSVYAKAGLSGRSELSAFFLEDLFLPGENTFIEPKTIDPK